MSKYIFLVILGLFTALIAHAQVVVSPKSVGAGTRQIFTVNVANDKKIPVTGLRLVVPEGIKSVTPNIKPGWKITVKKQPTGGTTMTDGGVVVAEQIPQEIVWTGGSIPAGFGDEFLFVIQTPTSNTSLVWKAYQTYSDGSVVAWDQIPGENVKNPYSITAVVDDLSGDVAPRLEWWKTNQVNVTLGVSLLALIVSLAMLLKNDYGKHK